MVTKMQSIRENPVYAEALRILNNARDKERQLVAEIERAKEQSRASLNSDHDVSAQARNYLDGKQIGIKTNENLEKLHAELRVIRRAIELQTCEMNLIETRLSSEAFKDHENEAKEHWAQIADCVKSLQEAIGGYKQFFEELIQTTKSRRELCPPHFRVWELEQAILRDAPEYLQKFETFRSDKKR